ncbi:MAG: RimK family protein [Roseateles sp.]|uniref:RimK family protein n=1 Tax=Roseateles sp. TaxID=1971397 RepID=UPI0040363446
MNLIVVTDQLQDWFQLPAATVVTARHYLADAVAAQAGDASVLNLCRTGRYQGRGYYVSLLAEARGHRPLPEVKSIEDLKAEAFVQAIAGRVDMLVQDTLQHDSSDLFELDVYLGRDPARRHDALAERLYAEARLPLLRVLLRREQGRWMLDALQSIGLADVPSQDRAFLLQAVQGLGCAAGADAPRRRTDRPRLAILWDRDEPHKPSNEAALQRFVETAPLVGLQAELVGPGDLERLPEFDALFNRASPEVDGIVYEFVRRAEAMGMPVVDDPESILRCLNKAYMHELMTRHRIAQPRSLIVHRDSIGQVVPTLGLPCVIKLPDSGFGLDVLKIESEAQLGQEAERFLKVSELFVAQEWLPSEFDWRVGVYDGRPLYVAKYWMAPGHWKIMQETEGSDELIEGKTEAMTIGEAPRQVIETAVRAANLIGRGLYGVDLKQVEDRVYLIEVNCNPNIDAGNEDQVLGEALYREVLGVFARRIAEHRHGAAA